MTKLEQAARQALEALEESCYPRLSAKHTDRYEEAITALQEALAEQEKPLYRKVLREMLDAHEQAEQEPIENNDWKKASYIRETLNAEQAEQEPVGMVIGGVFEPWNDDILSGAHELYAALVAAHEREKHNSPSWETVDDAIAAEREACAKVCEELATIRPTTGAGKLIAQECAAAIRERGDNK